MHISHCPSARRSAISLALASALLLAGCGGGGSTRPDTNTGGGGTVPTDPCEVNPQHVPGCPGYIPRYKRPQDNLLVPTAIDKAHEAGFTGAGVKIAVMDSGIYPEMAAFEGLDYTFHSFLDQGEGLPPYYQEPNDTMGHGSLVLAALAGQPGVGFDGGVAPDATYYIGQACHGNNCGTFGSWVRVFYDQDVRLFNFSIGAPSTNYGYDSAPGWEFEGQPARISSTDMLLMDGYVEMVAGGALFVWGAGNKGPQGISTIGVAPYFAPELEPGWLMVAGVRFNNDGEVTGLGSNVGYGSSSNCGLAKNWCLVAPWEVIVPNQNDVPISATGTSLATPIVTGVAALTWQAFPWMTNENVKWTLLTTATHLSDDAHLPTASWEAGVAWTPNETYGWGLVNAWRAIHGPGQFDEAFEADIGSYHSTFSNPISGEGSLVLDGNVDGVLELSGENTYSGGTTINGANLLLSGSLASDVTVNGGSCNIFGCTGGGEGGALMGYGIVHADVINNGGIVWSTNQLAGTGLSITGDYTASDDATTMVALGHTLTVGGTATVDGTLAVTPAEDTYTVESLETLLSAGDLVGTFDETDFSGVPFYNVSIEYSGNDVLANVSRANVSSVMAGVGGSAEVAADSLEHVLGFADQWSINDYGSHAAFLGSAAQFLSASSMEQAKASLESISGEAHGTVMAVQAATSDRIDHAVAAHQFTNLANRDTSVWVQGFHTASGLSADGYASSTSRDNGVLMGIGTGINGDNRIGVLLGSTRTQNEMAGFAGTVDQHDQTVGIYGNGSLGGGMYLAGRATWTRSQMEMDREVLLGDELSLVHTNRDDDVTRATVELGKDYGSFTPYASVTGLYLHQGEFEEEGVEGFALKADGQGQSVTMANLGVRFDKGFDWAGGDSRLLGYLSYRRILAGDETSFHGALTGAEEAGFTIAGQPLVRDMGDVGVTFFTAMSEHWNWYIGANYQASPGRYHNFEGNLGLRYDF